MADEKGIAVKKEDDFSEWYTNVVVKSGVAEYSSVSGCLVLKPLGYEIWERIKNRVDNGFKKLGIKNAYFPLFIPEKLLNKEKEHFEGFTPEVAWVTHAGNTKLDERLAVRPTSETIMYDSYKNWIRSWRDLPLKINQWNNVVRWEFKHPVLLLRTREFLWNEGHTCFATKEEAEAEGKDIINIYKDTTENMLALPGFIGKKTDKEKFAGAEYTITIEHLLPQGKAIQGPDFHYDGQNFSKAFGIKFLNQDEKEQYVYQNTFAISTREIGVMIAVHSDNKGLVLPPEIAPLQIIIIPIFKAEDKEKVLKEAEKLKHYLKEFSVELDERDYYTPGWKYHEYEMKGVPLRIEIGPKDIEKEQVVFARRDNHKKEFVKIKDIEKYAKETLDDIQKSLYKKAKNFLDESTVKITTFKEFSNAINDKKIVLAPFCGDIACEEDIKQKSDGVKSLNMPLEQKSISEKCFCCSKPAKFWVHFGKSY